MTETTGLRPAASSMALLIVDLQNDFLAPDGAYARGGATNPAALDLPEKVAKVAQAIRRRGGMVAASQFTLWPNANGAAMVSPHLRQLRPFLRNGDFAPGSWGHAHVAELDGLVDVSVCKVAYSAFFHTQLDWVLRHAGIDTVAVCGIVTNGGVASTARDAHMREYHTIVLEDACAAFTQQTHDVAIRDLSTVAEVSCCDTYITMLESGAPGQQHGH